ncbi:hypothetical protein DPMN_073900 [Dreissena polymorpha]|uniref:Uncharacterized protein n=1 Tax=Dreissena polymorpha TaxID=45954 RepID=A0A9D3YE78_DREPO|nr:hypothetical protein DPMN_073900 [Dreissena polymorpha]
MAPIDPVSCLSLTSPRDYSCERTRRGGICSINGILLVARIGIGRSSTNEPYGQLVVKYCTDLSAVNVMA